MQNNKKYFLFIAIILLFGFLFGIFYYVFLNNEVKVNISNSILDISINHNVLIKDLIVMSILLVTSFFVVGGFFGLFYLFYETLSYGFLISVYFDNFGFSGILYSLIFILLNKLLILILMILFIKKVLNVSRLIIGRIIYRRDYSLKNKLLLNATNSLYMIIFVVIINLCIYYVSPRILESLNFLLK